VITSLPDEFKNNLSIVPQAGSPTNVEITLKKQTAPPNLATATAAATPAAGPAQPPAEPTAATEPKQPA